MGIACWVHHWGDAHEQEKDLLARALISHGMESAPLNQDRPGGPGVCIFDEITEVPLLTPNHERILEALSEKLCWNEAKHEAIPITRSPFVSA